MENEFIPYDQALALKELGFDKECFGYYHYKKYYQYGLDFENIIFKYKCKLIDKGFNLYPNDEIKRDVYILEKDKSNSFCKAPLYQQAFRWFRNKYKLQCYPMLDTENIYWCLFSDGIGSGFLMKDGDYGYDSENHLEFKTYEEAELECLKKLIEIVKNK